MHVRALITVSPRLQIHRAIDADLLLQYAFKDVHGSILPTILIYHRTPGMAKFDCSVTLQSRSTLLRTFYIKWGFGFTEKTKQKRSCDLSKLGFLVHKKSRKVGFVTVKACVKDGVLSANSGALTSQSYCSALCAQLVHQDTIFERAWSYSPIRSSRAQSSTG